MNHERLAEVNFILPNALHPYCLYPSAGMCGDFHELFFSVTDQDGRRRRGEQIRYWRFSGSRKRRFSARRPLRRVGRHAADGRQLPRGSQHLS